jgi:hypothetical protein
MARAVGRGKRSMTADGGVVLTPIPSTTLYQPASRGPGENMLFLRWATASPPSSLPLEDVWADTGAPPTPGYVVFLNAVPSPGNASALEQGLRAALPAPKTTGFVWAIFPGSPLVQTLLKTRLDIDGKPCVDGDTPFNGRSGFPDLGFGDGALVIAARNEGFIGAFAVAYPPALSPMPSLGSGVTLPMTGATVGCVQFQGLINAFGSARQTSAIKALVSVSMDPLHPLDRSRNFITYAGPEYQLTVEGNTAHLSAVA